MVEAELPPDDWSLPVVANLHLTRGELLCIDFFTCGDYLSKMGWDLEDIAETWEDFRRVVYLAIHELSVPKTRHLPLQPPIVGGPWPVYPVKIPPELVQFLFMFLPPSFKWGTGADEGHSLKIKLAANLMNLPEDQDADSTDQAESAPKDTPATEA